MQTAEMTAMLEHDEEHWWYRGHRRVIRAELDRLPLRPDARLLDAGCGSGRTLDELIAYGAVSGVDLCPQAVDVARHRGHADVRVDAVEALPFGDESFDVVTCLDVIEHIPDDRATLTELLRVTTPGGLALVTVPAYQALWSTHDEVNLHYRRYGRRQLAPAGRGGRRVRLRAPLPRPDGRPARRACPAVRRDARARRDRRLAHDCVRR